MTINDNNLKRLTYYKSNNNGRPEYEPSSGPARVVNAPSIWVLSDGDLPQCVCSARQ